MGNEGLRKIRAPCGRTAGQHGAGEVTDSSFPLPFHIERYLGQSGDWFLSMVTKKISFIASADAFAYCTLTGLRLHGGRKGLTGESSSNFNQRWRHLTCESTKSLGIFCEFLPET